MTAPAGRQLLKPWLPLLRRERRGPPGSVCLDPFGIGVEEGWRGPVSPLPTAHEPFPEEVVSDVVEVLLKPHLGPLVQRSAAVQLLSVRWDSGTLSRLCQPQVLEALVGMTVGADAAASGWTLEASPVSAPVPASHPRASHADAWSLQAPCLKILTGLAQAQASSFSLLHDLVFRRGVAVARSVVFHPAWEVREAAAGFLSCLLFAPEARRYATACTACPNQDMQSGDSGHGANSLAGSGMQMYGPSPGQMYCLQLPEIFTGQYSLPFPVRDVPLPLPCREDDTNQVARFVEEARGLANWEPSQASVGQGLPQGVLSLLAVSHPALVVQNSLQTLTGKSASASRSQEGNSVGLVAGSQSWAAVDACLRALSVATLCPSGSDGLAAIPGVDRLACLRSLLFHIPLSLACPVLRQGRCLIMISAKQTAPSSK
eukprot:jgi/Botrbrau1/7668/Bobra.0159s0110.1